MTLQEAIDKMYKEYRPVTVEQAAKAMYYIVNDERDLGSEGIISKINDQLCIRWLSKDEIINMNNNSNEWVKNTE